MTSFPLSARAVFQGWLLIALAGLTASAATAQTWDDRFRLNPVRGETETYQALAASGDTLFLGGRFEALHSFDLPRDAPEAPPVPAAFNSIGWFDGTTWRQMGYGLRSNRDPASIYGLDPGVVKDILIDGEDVYAAGRFHAYEIGENQLITQNHIARWSRANNRWEGLNFGLAVRKTRKGSSYDGAVEALLRWKGDLYAAGTFSGSCDASECEVEDFGHDYNAQHETLARWDGTQWQTADPSIERFLGVREEGAGLYALVEASNGDLVAAGDVTELRKADGSSLFCDGIFRIKVGGGVSCLGGGTARNGTNGTVYALTVDEATGDLIVAGDFTSVDDDSDDATPGITAQNVARWNGTAWSAVGLGLDGTVRDLRYRDGAIQAFGDFPTHAGRFGPGGWQTLGRGTAQPVTATTETSDGLVAATDVLAAWDRKAWAPWGLGLAGTVEDIAVDPVDGSVYVAGGFPGPPGARASDRIARWDGAQWQPVGQGLSAGEFTIKAVAAHDGIVYVGGGRFTARQPDGSTLGADGVVRWDGTQWAALDEGIALSDEDGSYSSSCGPIRVDHLAVTGEGTVYVGGCFAGAYPANENSVGEHNFVRWDGGQWHPTGGYGTSQADPRMRSLSADASGVYVIGAGSPADVFSDGLAYYRPTETIIERVGAGPRVSPSWQAMTYGGRVRDVAYPFVAASEVRSRNAPQTCTVSYCPPFYATESVSGVVRRQRPGSGWVDLGAPGAPGHVTKIGGTVYADFFASNPTATNPFGVSEIRQGTDFDGIGTVEYAGSIGIQDLEADGARLYVGGALQRAGGFSAGGFAIWNSGRTLADSDGDGLSDADETLFGSGSGGVDTDGDGLTDVQEAGDDLLLTPPIDTDADGAPDFNDPDDDGDGIDTATEIASGGTHGNDVDGDGRPNWLDEDADGDTVPDEFEGTADSNSNGVPDYLDPSYAELRLRADASNLANRFVPVVPSVPGFYDVGFIFQALDADAVLQIKRRAPGPPDVPAGQVLVADRSWVLDIETDVTFDTHVCFDLAALQLPDAADPTRFKIYKRENAQSAWAEQATELRPNATDATRLCATGVTSFSEFAVTAAPDALPVELTVFEAVQSAAGIILAWETASETQNAGFHVQRRLNPDRPFVDIEFVAGAGTTDRPQAYRYTDRQVPFAADRATYRLRQVDTDGTETLSDEVEVALGAPAQLRLHAPFPNPARTAVMLRVDVPEATNVHIAVYDMLGRRVATLADGTEPAGRFERRLDTRRLPSGLYVVRLQAGGAVRTQRFTIVQ